MEADAAGGRHRDAADELKRRTFAFAVRVINLVRALPRNMAAEIIGKQLLRAGTSVGSNYRAACRARSHADFIAKLGIVEEECDETIYWLELLVGNGLMSKNALGKLMSEAEEILAIIVASIRTSKSRGKLPKRAPHSAIRNPKSAIRPEAD